MLKGYNLKTNRHVVCLSAGLPGDSLLQHLRTWPLFTSPPVSSTMLPDSFYARWAEGFRRCLRFEYWRKPHTQHSRLTGVTGGLAVHYKSDVDKPLF